MMATRGLTVGNTGLPAGMWRWAALGFIFLAIAAAALAVSTPDAARWAGVMLLAGIGALASIFLYAIWPKESLNTAAARRGARLQSRLPPHGGRRERRGRAPAGACAGRRAIVAGALSPDQGRIGG